VDWIQFVQYADNCQSCKWGNEISYLAQELLDSQGIHSKELLYYVYMLATLVWGDFNMQPSSTLGFGPMEGIPPTSYEFALKTEANS
jgi:hypothetical protein